MYSILYFVTFIIADINIFIIINFIDIYPLKSSPSIYKKKKRKEINMKVKEKEISKSACMICLETGNSKSMTCPSAHALCLPCLSAYVNNISDFDNNDLYLKALTKAGHLKCPDKNCKFEFNNSVTISETIVPLLQNLESSFLTFVKKSEVEQQKRIEENQRAFKSALLPELDTLTNDDEALQIIRRYIQEEILCMRCPQCSHVFCDFSGCSFVTCVYPGCNAHFCGICLHIRAHQNGELCYQGGINLADAWNALRIHKVNEYVNKNLYKKSAAFKQRLSVLMKKDFNDLGLSIKF